MTVDVAYRICQYVVNKAQGGYLKPADFNLVINQGSASFLDFLLGEIKQGGTNVELWLNRKMRNSLSFHVIQGSLIIDASGRALCDPNYTLIDAMYTSDLKRIRFVQQSSLYSYLESTIDPIADNPIYTILGGAFQFYPVTLGSARISYVRKPFQIVWAYTLDTKGRAVYDAVNSVDPVWLDTDMLSVIARSLRIVGINLQNGMVEQYAREIAINGQ